MQTIGDTTFGIDHQALSILHFLAGDQPGFADECEHDDERYDIEIFTRTLYNGREKHVALQVMCEHDMEEHLVISFGEGRSSDSIGVTHWLVKQGPYNHPPSIDDATEEDYDQRKYFNYGDVTAAAKFVVKLMKKYYTERKRQLKKQAKEAQAKRSR